MESTKLIKALDEIRNQYAHPVSQVQVVRDIAQRELARLHNIELPPMFSEEHRKTLLANVDVLSDFLSGEDGADAIELLMDSFNHYVEKKEASKPKTAEVDQLEFAEEIPDEE